MGLDSLSSFKDTGLHLLSDFVLHTKYARYREEGRRESYEEIVKRLFDMHRTKFDSVLSKDRAFRQLFNRSEELVLKKLVLPSMRSLHFGGSAIEINNQRMYNCSFLNLTCIEDIRDVVHLLCSGCGVGYSVQKHHIKNFPKAKGFVETETQKYIIDDSIEGWASAVYKIMEAFVKGQPEVEFDFSRIREKGSLLKTSGGKAPGPEPLRILIKNIKDVLTKRVMNQKGLFKPIDIHDIICFIGNAIMVGGTRRAALISLFSFDDKDMLSCKDGNFWEKNPQRSRSNNSAVIDRKTFKYEDVEDILNKTLNEGFGEPGLFFTNDLDWGTNPCAEIALRSHGFCNLTTLNAEVLPYLNKSESEELFIAASLLGTLQAAYTDFNFISDRWRQVAEEDSLLGVSMTGLSALNISEYKSKFRLWANTVNQTNEFVSKKIGINPAKRTTCVKPEGSTSCVLMTSSGIHPYHSKYFLRSVRVNKTLGVYNYLKEKDYPLIEDDALNPDFDAVVYFPCKAPDNARVVSETSGKQVLDDVMLVYENWVKPGHREGANTHNVSVTIPFKPEEREEIRNHIIKNNDKFTSVSLFPHDDNNYPQAPFSRLDYETYKELSDLIATAEYKFDHVKEDFISDSHIELTSACAGGACEIL